MTEPLSFTLNGPGYKITSTTVNPLSNAKPTNGNWKYFLHYYSGANGQPEVLTCTTTDLKNPNQVVYVCGFAQGGGGGTNGGDNTNRYQTWGGGGGGGQCANKEMVFPVTATLYPIGNNNQCTILSKKTSSYSGECKLQPGGSGGAAGENGGAGGKGGGAGGNGGYYGEIKGAANGTGGTAGFDSGYGFTANQGNGYTTTGPTDFTVVYTKQTFSDGTSANLAQGGVTGYWKTQSPQRAYTGQSGNIAGVLFCYKVSG